MEDLLAAILSGILECLGEVFFQVLCESVLLLVAHAMGNVFSAARPKSRVLAAIGYLLLGIATGVASLFLFPHHLVRPSRFHGISLLLSPLATGFIMSRIGVFLRSRGKTSVPIESFAYGFVFAFGIAIIRLMLVH